ncbi:predicted protein [Chaetoceros tenuissimus]|uniref:Uncharacterized protein n=1 Tax=Chaetoceros tenuissimus TaxID=426638 RepID=A0AAD3D6L2_9STRA|nr:predicted protein [Chaetoceros tenuissimus]
MHRPLSRLDSRYRTNGFPLTRSLKQSKECLKVVYILGFDSATMTDIVLQEDTLDPSIAQEVSAALENILKEDLKEINGDWEMEPEISVDHVNVESRLCPETFEDRIICYRIDTELDIAFDMSRKELEANVRDSLKSSMENGDFLNRIQDDFLSEIFVRSVTYCGEEEEGFTSDHAVVLSTLAIMVMTLVLLFISKRRSRKRDADVKEVPQEEDEEVEPEPIKVGFRNRVSVIVPEGEAKNYEELKTERVVNKFRGSVIPTNVVMDDEDDEEEEKREVDDHHMDLEVVNVRVQEEFLPTSESTSTRSLMTGSVAYNV